MEQKLYLGCQMGPVLLKDEHALDLPPQQVYIFPYQILSLSFLQDKGGCLGFVFKQYGLFNAKDLFVCVCVAFYLQRYQSAWGEGAKKGQKQLCEEAGLSAGSQGPKEHLEQWKPQRFLLLGLVGAG